MRLGLRYKVTGESEDEQNKKEEQKERKRNERRKMAGINIALDKQSIINHSYIS